MSTVVISAVASSAGVGSATVGGTCVEKTAGGQAGVVVRSRLHITRRGRLVITALAAVPIVAGALVLALNGGVAVASGPGLDAGYESAGFEYVTIKSGQSLWQLAESVAPGADPRDVIADIVRLNQLPTTEVQPGQRLALPND